MIFKIEGTRQEIFDKVCIHLAQQKKPAMESMACKYRIVVDDEVLKCSIGCLVPDEYYSPKFDSGQSNTIKDINKKGLIKISRKIGTVFLSQLQSVHDRSETIGKLKTDLRLIAIDYDLSYEKVDLITEWNY